MASKVEIVSGGQDYAEALAADIRADDALEVKASGGYLPIDAVRGAIESSTGVWTMVFDGHVAGIYGVAAHDLVDGLGVIWLMTSNVVDRYRKTFLKTTIKLVPTMLELYPVLFNMVDARYLSALRWAKRVGFEVRPAVPYGVQSLPFHPIVLRRSSCVNPSLH